MAAFLVQSVCISADGAILPLLPIDVACTARRPQTPDDTVYFRKHDWPDRLDPRHPVDGYQASDSVVNRGGPVASFVQTFDFGDAVRAFGRFDAGLGDGGQVAVLVDGWASIAMTEDGGDGVQWFISDDCVASPLLAEHLLGWRLFGNDVEDGWREDVTRLNKARSAAACPLRFNSALVRYRRGVVGFPFRVVDEGRVVRTARVAVETVVSEHFGAASVEAADHLERFYFARDLGLVRWERWAHPGFWQRGTVEREAARFAESGRCPVVDGGEALDENWKLVDCRMWTALVITHGGWSVGLYRWPAGDWSRGAASVAPLGEGASLRSLDPR